MSRRILFLPQREILFAALCLAGIPSAHASPIRRYGIELSCETCNQISPERCEIVINGERVLANCGYAFYQTLSKEIDTAAINSLEPESVLRALLHESPDENISLLLIRVLLSSEAGQALCKSNINAVVAVLERTLQSPEAFQALSNDETQFIWTNLLLGYSAEVSALRAKFVAYSSAIPMDELFAFFSGDISRDISQLDIWEQSIPADVGTWHQLFSQLRDYLVACRTLETRGSFHNDCQIDKFPLQGAAYEKYAARIIANAVLRFVSSENTDPINALRTLANSNYESFRTPQTNEAVLRVLTELGQTVSAEDIRRVFHDEYIRKLLLTFSANDSAITAELSSILKREALQALRNNDFSDLGSLFSLLTRITPHEQILSDPFYTEFVSELDDSRANSGQTFRSSIDPVVLKQLKTSHSHFWTYLLCAALIFLGSCGIVFRVKTRRDEAANIREEGLNYTERCELQKLRNYFGLTVWSSEEDLRFKYREKAKQVHPDKNANTIEDFLRLNSNFERAQQLMARST